jgi:hypothetical protein
VVPDLDARVCVDLGEAHRRLTAAASNLGNRANGCPALECCSITYAVDFGHCGHSRMTVDEAVAGTFALVRAVSAAIGGLRPKAHAYFLTRNAHRGKSDQAVRVANG